jgi:hypothetical protein
MVPGVLKHPRVWSRNYLVPFLAFFVSSATGEGAGGRVGASGMLSSLAPVLGELPIFDQQIKTGAASVGLLVRPFVHAQLAIDEDFLALLKRACIEARDHGEPSRAVKSAGAAKRNKWRDPASAAQTGEEAVYAGFALLLTERRAVVSSRGASVRL